MKTALISIIIPTYNEQDHIDNCINSLKNQTYKKTEIIVVDDGSTDGTKAILKNTPNITFLKQKHAGPGKARNLGAKKARGDILVFADADMIFDSNFIKNLTLPIIKNQTIGTFTKQEFVSNHQNPWAQSWSLVRGFEKGKMHPTNFPDQQPVFRAIKKSAFIKAGGFDSNRGYDDDWSISEKLGSLATHAPKAYIYHANPDSPSQIYQQAKWMAKRKYKFGIIGKLGNLSKLFLPLSTFFATIELLKHRSPHAFATKIIVDLASCIGIIQTIFTQKTSK